MNLREFLELVDYRTSEMEKNQLVNFIHNYARVLPEIDRFEFLKLLRKAMHEQDVKQIDKVEREKLSQQFEELKIKLLDIENGNAYIYGELNEEYDDWYDNGEEFLYEDNYEIGQIV